MLDNPDLNGRLHAQLFQALRQLCGHTGSLPSSYILSAGILQKLHDQHSASGGFADVWLGCYEDQNVALKAFRLYDQDNLQIVRKVNGSLFCLQVTVLCKTALLEILQRSNHVEAPIASKYYTISRNQYYIVPVVHGQSVDVEW